eukprot:366294-Chlamydomonas_euryale.AAC.3
MPARCSAGNASAVHCALPAMPALCTDVRTWVCCVNGRLCALCTASTEHCALPALCTVHCQHCALPALCALPAQCSGLQTWA